VRPQHLRRKKLFLPKHALADAWLKAELKKSFQRFAVDVAAAPRRTAVGKKSPLKMQRLRSV